MFRTEKLSSSLVKMIDAFKRHSIPVEEILVPFGVVEFLSSGRAGKQTLREPKQPTVCQFILLSTHVYLDSFNALSWDRDRTCARSLVTRDVSKSVSQTRSFNS